MLPALGKVREFRLGVWGVGLQRSQLGELHVWAAKSGLHVSDVVQQRHQLNHASCLSWTISYSNLQLTCTPPLSAFSVPVASWRLRETNDDLVLRKRVDWLDTRDFDRAGLLRDVGACVPHSAVGCKAVVPEITRAS